MVNLKILFMIKIVKKYFKFVLILLIRMFGIRLFHFLILFNIVPFVIELIKIHPILFKQIFLHFLIFELKTKIEFLYFPILVMLVKVMVKVGFIDRYILIIKF